MSYTKDLAGGAAIALALLFSIASSGAEATEARPFLPPDFEVSAPQGFGDRQNSHSWSMIWWNDHLYVGTGRATSCVQQASIAFYRPDLGTYPANEPDVECTESPQDLPLQAEIWRLTPATDQWDLVYRSPQDIPIPGHPGKFVAREIGLRGMMIFQEPDGTEALYVAGVGARTFNEPGIPAPRLLRSTDGASFEPIPADPGTFLGDIPYDGFRGLLTYKGRMFVLATTGLLGHGVILESENPAGGNDNFRLVTPPGMTFFELEVFNDLLYLGTGVQPLNEKIPFSVLKTDAEGAPPYDLTPVIEDGAYRKSLPGYAVVSMQVFKNRLYVGTERELLRINPDDTWELVVGTPRRTPMGKIYPISGFDYGFDSFFNIHMWRMTVHDGVLYVGTHDQSTKWRRNVLAPMFQARMGFDLFATTDGYHFTEVTRNGMSGYFDHNTQSIVLQPENVFDAGVRNFASSPEGLFVASANHYYGTNVWKANLPAVPELPAPGKLAVEGKPATTLLSWDASQGAVVYQIFRDTGYRAPEIIGSTPNLFFVDTTAEPWKTYHYSVMAASPLGKLSGPSNLVRSPFRGSTPTFTSLNQAVSRVGLPRSIRSKVSAAMRQAKSGRLAESLATLETLRQQCAQLPLLVGPLKAEQVTVPLDGLVRRVKLAILGLITPAKLVR
jgi:hypothetical protein